MSDLADYCSQPFINRQHRGPLSAATCSDCNRNPRTPPFRRCKECEELFQSMMERERLRAKP